nr:MAG TPA: hypothetical protein [Caudoviricetes sp.]
MPTSLCDICIGKKVVDCRPYQLSSFFIPLY